jgi:hypothetical protein
VLDRRDVDLEFGRAQHHLIQAPMYVGAARLVVLATSEAVISFLRSSTLLSIAFDVAVNSPCIL